jgi:S-formylglutathione hydrolase FrmB
LITESPQELDTASRSGAPLGKVLATVFGNAIVVQHWKDNSPFDLAKRNQKAIRSLSIYFNCGQDDNYGFEKGAAALHQQLQKEDVKHEYHLYPGDHSLSYFLAHFTEVMEFHSRAFGLKQRVAKPIGKVIAARP